MLPRGYACYIRDIISNMYVWCVASYLKVYKMVLLWIPLSWCWLRTFYKLPLLCWYIMYICTYARNLKSWNNGRDSDSNWQILYGSLKTNGQDLWLKTTYACLWIKLASIGSYILIFNHHRMEFFERIRKVRVGKAFLKKVCYWDFKIQNSFPGLASLCFLLFISLCLFPLSTYFICLSTICYATHSDDNGLNSEAVMKPN